MVIKEVLVVWNIYISLVHSFNLFIEVALGRTIWYVVDMIASGGLIVSLFAKPKKARVSKNKNPVSSSHAGERIYQVSHYKYTPLNYIYNNSF